MSDESLLERFADGDVDGFGALIRRHQETVLRVVRRYSSSAEDARDLAQRTFLQAFEALPDALPRLGRIPFRAWLLCIAMNLGKNHSRDAGRWLFSELPPEASTAAPSAERALEEAERRELIRRAVLELPPRQREVFALRVDAGLPFAEIGLALGITDNNAKSHFSLAVARMKSAVARLEADGGGQS